MKCFAVTKRLFLEWQFNCKKTNICYGQFNSSVLLVTIIFVILFISVKTHKMSTNINFKYYFYYYYIYSDHSLSLGFYN